MRHKKTLQKGSNLSCVVFENEINRLIRKKKNQSIPPVSNGLVLKMPVADPGCGERGGGGGRPSIQVSAGLS